MQNKAFHSGFVAIIGRPNVGKSSIMNYFVGEKVAIVSNKPDDAVALLCHSFFPGIYARGESSECRRKPAPDMVLAAMKALGAERGIYVGDSEVDIATSRNAGLPCLSVLWGFRTREELQTAGAEYLAADTAALEKIVLG